MITATVLESKAAGPGKSSPRPPEVGPCSIHVNSTLQGANVQVNMVVSWKKVDIG